MVTQLGITAQIIHLDGAVEISIQLGVADVIADVVQSGISLQLAGLKTVGEPLLTSEAILIGCCHDILDRPQVKSLFARLKGIVIAREYAMLEYDLPEALLDQAIALTPGIESPTIARLYKEEWLAIKAMVKRHDVNSLLDKLEALGAKGVIVTNIQNCRL
jgi:ATP phosphoribosyltransferase